MSAPVPEPVQVVRELRDRALTASASELGFAPTPEYPKVFGFVMDIGYRDALVTLVSFVDGTTSLYFGNGGGVIGAGEHEAVRQSASNLLTRAQGDLKQFGFSDSFPLPTIGEVRFYVRTYAGVRGGRALEHDLAMEHHRLSPLFVAAQNVIAALRQHAGGVNH